MDIAVLVKVVPAHEKLRYDAQRKTMIRDGVELFVNPFDQRAIRVALDLRRPGERVTLISMGPLAAEAALREGLALGVDRAILLTDPALAGSDTLATARALTRAVLRVGHDLVLTGRWSTDSETGQVGPEVAGLLGIPVVSGARRLHRDEVGTGMEIAADTDKGWVRIRGNAPLVVTVGEKITKIRKPSGPETAAAAGREVDRLDAAQLGLAPEVVGLSGSPTVVMDLVDEAPERQAVLIPEGAADVRAEAVAAALRYRLSQPRPSPADPPEWVGPLSDSKEVVVLVSGPDGHLNPASLSVVAEVRRSLPSRWVSGVWVGASPHGEELRTLAQAGMFTLRRMTQESGGVGSRSAAMALQAWLAQRPTPRGMAFVADSFGREVAGQLAARAGLGLTGDAVGMKLDADGEILWRKPAFGGGIVAGIRSRTHPSLATVRPTSGGTLLPAAGPDDLDVEVIDIGPPPDGLERLEEHLEVDPRYGDLDSARVVLTVGMGIGGPDRLPALVALLEPWHAALAATRRVVDAGWVPRQLQVGLTGRSLAPELAILIGVHGSVNHLVGWKRARTLLAFNSDPSAPVLGAVDVAVVGRWEELFEPMVRALDPVIGSIPPPPR